MKKKEVCLVTGGFDPLHSGHVSYFKEAAKVSDYLVVGINSDKWLKNKKKVFLLPWIERASVIKNLKFVDKVIDFDDEDGSAINAIFECLKFSDHVVFANGGDRDSKSTPEIEVFKNNPRVKFLYSVGGGDKKNSSSWLLSDFTSKYFSVFLPEGIDNIETIEAPWGVHTSFIDSQGFKVKQLTVNPGGILSLQKHQHRMEHWIVGSGIATVELDGTKIILHPGEYIKIPKKSIHRLSNESNENLVVIEVQCGKILEESDIIRLEDSYGRKS
jgi:cytidyltransferase-like protein